MLIHLKRFAAIFIAAISVLGIGIMFLLYNEVVKFVSISIFYVLIILFSLLLISILISKRPVFDENEQNPFRRLKISKKWFYLLAMGTIGVYVFSLFFDLLILNTVLYSTIMLIVGLVISIVLTRFSYRLALFCVLFLFLSYLIATYAFYPPSLGNDTWRDINSALIITKTGHTGGITYAAYPLPVVSILYAMISLPLDISPVNASALMGIVYLLMTASLAFLISNKLGNKLNTFSSFMTVILILSIPLITLWSVGFIPEAYTFIIFLSLLLILFSSFHKTNDILILFPLLIAIVLGHGGVDLWCIGFLASLIIMMRLLGAKQDNAYISIKRVLWILTLVTLIYFVYTTLLGTITISFHNIVNVLLNFITSPGTASSARANITVSNGSPNRNCNV